MSHYRHRCRKRQQVRIGCAGRPDRAIRTAVVVVGCLATVVEGYACSRVEGIHLDRDRYFPSNLGPEERA